ncbi:MAG: acetyl-CoA carboxylase biotin carboxyl carrier protein [Myxococcales bacterium]|nr:acetyl-CoA carboxylase biotin carboxyl carrier protein [Myxococcales bacterium]MBK7195141.1 acetyl-CoA carboxylase biotin carboxyl carrier protein [Myxococcales bacterium]MBP6849220.1 acetyl-CoA carboxylase biotin carboxyl carrier protein [Kofleriaceae bacterium]
MATGRKGSKQTPAPTSAPATPTTDAGGDDIVAIARGLAAAVSEHGLTELIIETPDATYTVRRGGTPVVMPTAMAMPAAPMAPLHHAPVAAAPAAAPAAPAPVVDDKSHIVKSPFVGTFYRRPNPDASEYVKLNDKVKKGSVLCIIEAMKLMNEIESDVAGTVLAVLAEDGAPVEYDQPLFKIAVA